MRKDVPFSISFAVIFSVAFAVFTTGSHVSASELQSRFAELGAVIGIPETVPQPSEAALAERIIAFPPLSVLSAASSSATSNATSSSTPVFKSGLLPKVRLGATRTASRTVQKNIPAANTPPVAAITPTAPIVTTAQSFLKNTTLSFHERLDGPFEAVFTTNVGGGKSVTWGLDKTIIGGTGTVPQFGVSFSCSPIPAMPLPGDADQNPSFAVRTPYDCTVSLQPMSGSDERVQSQDFKFQTPGGRLSITTPPAMSTVLKSGEDDGGFIFNNEDSEAVSITNLKLDVSYMALNNSSGPLILRFTDPKTDATLAEYHLENLPANPSVPYSYGQSGIEIPVSFTVPAQSQLVLLAKILGVSQMDISNVNPTLTLVLRDIASNEDKSNIVLTYAKMNWSCIVAIGSYDPNATSGPFATGQACQ